MAIEWAANALAATIEHAGVDHGGGAILQTGWTLSAFDAGDLRQFETENVALEKEAGMEGHVLGGRRLTRLVFGILAGIVGGLGDWFWSGRTAGIIGAVVGFLVGLLLGDKIPEDRLRPW